MKELDNNLNCSKARSVIDDLMTDEMPPSVVSHISRCSECRDHASTNARLRELVRDSHRVTAPADFDVRLRERLQNRTSRPRSFWSFIPTPALAAAATFVVTAAITFGVLKHMHGNADFVASPVGNTQNTIAKDNPKAPVPPTDSAPVQTIVSSHPVAVATGGFTGRQTLKNTQSRIETPTEIPSETILLRDGQRGEQVMHVPQVIVGARSVVPRGSASKRPQYEPSVF